jgi:hypothetical protein
MIIASPAAACAPARPRRPDDVIPGSVHRPARLDEALRPGNPFRGTRRSQAAGSFVFLCASGERSTGTLAHAKSGSAPLSLGRETERLRNLPTPSRTFELGRTTPASNRLIFLKTQAEY